MLIHYNFITVRDPPPTDFEDHWWCSDLSRFHHGYSEGFLSRVFQPDDVLSYMEMCSTIG
jgi:hypothetical protein